MPVVRDYRKYSFLPNRIDRCGRDIGSKLYWKLYAVENTIRIVVHSVLSAQIGTNWWISAVDQTIITKAQRFRASYVARPQNANPGIHDVHLIFLSDLTEIIRANSNLFRPVVPDIDLWISRLEGIRVPRNLVGHMNFPNAYDRNAIINAYSQLPSLISHLKARNVPLEIAL
jgi:hypothetical protein